MKIGILTFHRALNYGAVLQCYALFETLRCMGHDVEVIDYRPECIEKERWAFCRKIFRRKSLMQKVKYLLLTPFKCFSKRNACKSFDKFIQERFILSSIVETMSDIPNNYDVIVFGSDQIWSPIICDGFDPIYFGQIAKEKKTRFISYAASMEGYRQISSDQWKNISVWLANFDAISVREKSLQEELAKHIVQTVEWVVDPTLMISPFLLEKLAYRPSLERYVLLFTVQPGNQPYCIAQQVASARGIKVVRVRASGRMNLQNRERNLKILNAVSPELFVGLIKHAECVVTNSFHAVVISLQLGKDFYAVECEHPLRIVDILNTVGLQDRYVKKEDAFFDKTAPIDYSKVRVTLDELASKANEYLKTNILGE